VSVPSFGVAASLERSRARPRSSPATRLGRQSTKALATARARVSCHRGQEMHCLPDLRRFSPRAWHLCRPPKANWYYPYTFVA